MTTEHNEEEWHGNSVTVDRQNREEDAVSRTWDKKQYEETNVGIATKYQNN